MKGIWVNKKMKIRRANEADAELIVKLIQKSFDTHMLRAMIYGCHGIAQYVRQCISIPVSLADTFFVVAEDKGRIIGCCELRLIGKTLLLNYICTSADMRHKGIGGKLLRQAIVMLDHTSFDKMSLDVFDVNFEAKSWYEKMGFISEYSTDWWSIPCNNRTGVSTGKISGIAQANVCQREFGFSKFLLNTETASYSVGRLGSEWFRIGQVDILTDDQAMATLSKLEDSRRILGLFNKQATITINTLKVAKPFCHSNRMTADLKYLVKTLTD